MELNKNLFFKQVGNSIKFAFKDIRSILITITLSSITFTLLGLTTDIGWHLQTLSYGYGQIPNILLNGFTNIYLGGYISLIISIIYSIVTGIALTNLISQIKRFRTVGKSLGTIIPGFAATGCASCGLGLLSLIGFTNTALALPFDGNLLKISAILLLIYALNEMGRPEVCSIYE